MGETKNDDELHELLSTALDDELPDGAEERCIRRITMELEPIRVNEDGTLIEPADEPEDADRDSPPTPRRAVPSTESSTS